MSGWASKAAPVGAAVLAGALAGAVIGALRVIRSEDLDHAMPYLAATRAVPPALACAGYGLLLGMLLVAGARWARPPRRLVALGTAIACAAGIGYFLAGPLRDVAIPAELARDRPRFAVFAALAIAGLWTVPWAAAWPWQREAARRAIGILGVGGAIAGLALLAGAAALPLAGRARGASRPPVIVVSLDTMRADALGALGGSDTPRLDRFAAEGTLFERAVAPAPWTLPSHASIFTSRLPFDHGVCFSHQRIREPLVTLAEALRDAGYLTAAFTGNAYVDPTFGFDHGFMRYDAIHEDKDLARGPAPIAEAALAWMRSAGERPFFAFVHTYEPHSPYTETTFASPDDRGRLPAVVDFPVVERIHDGLDLDERERRYVRALYRGDVERTDRVMGGLLDALRDAGILDRAIVVVLSDHGEDFWEHDMRRSPGHGHSLYEELLHVPLALRAPGLPAGTRVATPVSLVDLAPTVLDLAGLPPVRAFHGRSLAAALREGREPEAIPVWAESVEYGPDRFAVRHGRYKAIVVPRPDIVHGAYHPEVEPLELFDLEADPGERVNLAGRAPAEARPLVAQVAERGRAKVRPGTDDTGPEDASDQLLETLRSLGYVR